MNAIGRSRILRVSSIAIIGLGAPLAFSPSEGITTNDACGSGTATTCCEQNKAACCYGTSECLANHYDNGVGKCPET